MLSIVYVASLSVMVIYTVQVVLSFKYQPVFCITGNKKPVQRRAHELEVNHYLSLLT